MKEKINALQKEIKNYSGSGAEGIEAFRMKYISKKSVINDLFEDFKKLSIEEKKEFGKTLNELKILPKKNFYHFLRSLQKTILQIIILTIHFLPKMTL